MPDRFHRSYELGQLLHKLVIFKLDSRLTTNTFPGCFKFAFQITNNTCPCSSSLLFGLQEEFLLLIKHFS
jgi:hypothetical protein